MVLTPCAWTISEGQRDPSEPAGRSGQPLISLLRCAVWLSLQNSNIRGNCRIFVNQQERENTKMLRSQAVNINAKASILVFFTISWNILSCSNVGVQNMDTIPTPCASTVWISLAMDLMRGFPWDFVYKNNQSRFLKHRNTFTFWLSLCSFPWLDRKHSHQSKWKGCSWPPSQFVVGEGPWNFGIQILGGDVGAYMDYI